MSITKQEVARIAKLSRLSFTEPEQEAFLEQFEQILEHVGCMNRIDTEGVEPCSNVFALRNVMREDVVTPSMDTSLLLKNAPCCEDGAYLVPKVVE